jgi:hypothetical protein
MMRRSILVSLNAVLLLCTSAGSTHAQLPTAASPPITSPPITVPEKPGKWRRAETEHFIFYSDGSEKALREDVIKLERFDHLMRLVTGVTETTSPVKLTVYFVSSGEKVRALYPGTVKQVVGFYNATLGGAYAVTPRSLQSYGDDYGKNYAVPEDVVLFHEYAHHLMLQYFSTAYPAWYVEGFAEFIGNARVERDGLAKYGLPNVGRAYSLLLGRQLPIEKLLTAQVADLKGNEAIESLYARGWTLTHYLHFEPSRKGQLGTYLNAVAKGTPSLDAARASFGDLKLLNRALDRYLEGRMTYTKMNRPLPEPKPFTVTQLGEGSSDAVLLQFKLTRTTAPKEMEPIAQALRTLAARFPDNIDIATALAEAETDLGNDAAGERAADTALKINPQSSRALLWKALSLALPLRRDKNTDAKKWKEVRGWIIKANRANPDDPLPLFNYYLSFIDAGQPAPDLAIQGLGKSVELVPQFDGARFTYAAALGGQKKYDLAVAVLNPVANDPHGGGTSDAARKIIATLERAKANGTVPDINLDDFDEEEKP